MKNPKGLTVVELIVTIAILAVAAAIATPSVTDIMSRARLKGASRQVLSDMKWARTRAVTEKNVFRIIFVDAHIYKILDDDDNDGKVDDTEWCQSKDIRKHYGDVSIGANASPAFYPRGNASMGTVTLKNGAGVKTVKIHITGRIKIV